MTLHDVFQHNDSILPKLVGPLSMAAPVSTQQGDETGRWYDKGKKPMLISKCRGVTTSLLLQREGADRKMGW